MCGYKVHRDEGTELNYKDRFSFIILRMAEPTEVFEGPFVEYLNLNK